jgi:hypothetical protein
MMALRREDLRGAETEEHKAQTTKVVQGKEEDDLLALDYEPGAGRNVGR